MKKTLFGAAFILLAAAPAANAACTMEQLQQKALAFSQKMQAMMQKDANVAQRFAPKAQEAAKKYQEAAAQGGTNYDEICKFYDELLVELEKS